MGAALPAAAVLALPPRLARAHSLPEVEARLHDREQFFQPFEARPAPDFALQDPEGRPVGLADLRGKVVVLHFIYASCPDVCPLHADLIARIQEMVSLTPMRERVRFVTITTDPERDTPEVMRGYGEARGLDPVNWTFLTSGAERPEEGRRLAEAYGLRFVPTPDGMQMHAVVTHAIDREGRLRARFHGLGFDPTNLVVYLNALTHDEDDEAHAPPPRPAPPQGLWGRLRKLL
ncbi:MAG: SCO family protein [Acetobacteraceae bacterium]|nr:SCO family protein [Acetobacteraceae bacterium]